MSEQNSEQPLWTEEDSEHLFATLGKYWVIFQQIESQLDKLLLLAWGHENWTRSQRKLAGMTNAAKVKAVKSVVLTTADFARAHTRPEWIAHFRSVLEALDAERKRRNSIIHSQVLFEFADKGLGPPLASSRTGGAGEKIFERHWLSREYQTELLAQLAKLCWDMNFAYVQLVHDYNADLAKGQENAITKNGK
jgi:hypothetical protein